MFSQSNLQLVKGVSFALLACFIWGMIFIIPQFMAGFSAIEIVLGRYFFYGLISLGFLIAGRRKGNYRYPFAFWRLSFFVALIVSMGYYTLFILGLRYCSPAICALIAGISPITISFYGNLQRAECSFKSLVFPAIFIFLGLVIINGPHLVGEPQVANYLLGLICLFGALFCWTVYAVKNSLFLKDHPEMKASEWSVMLGVSTLIWTFFIGSLLKIFFGSHFELSKYTHATPELLQFLLGSAVLGVVCSWMGSTLWNKASIYLPVSLAGQISIFETIFGMLFVYLLKMQLPPLTECIGGVFFLIAVTVGLSRFAKSSAEESIH